MLTPITQRSISTLHNDVFRTYAQSYLDIEQEYFKQIARFGLPFAEPISDERKAARTKRIDRMTQQGLNVENGGASLYVGWISPACIQCRKGLNTCTFLISVQCPKRCYFCFNPNQVNYNQLLTETHDVTAELEGYYAQRFALSDIALTGGEPMMHKEQTVAFFKRARELYPDAHTRLYTSGAYLNDKSFAELHDAGLDEIRFSIKMEESPAAHASILALIGRSRHFIDRVMVEMPVMPNEIEEMKDLLTRLNHIGIDSINLLELCYPLNNAQEFARRGYLIKNPPYNVLYNYWYAGGLPIDGSDEACLELLEFALDSKFAMGVHYCSLENKFTGQIYQQNRITAKQLPQYAMSKRDQFLKSIKAFGDDAVRAKKILAGSVSAQNAQRLEESEPWIYDAENNLVEMHPCLVKELKSGMPNTQIALSYNVIEPVEKSPAVRELRVDLTTPATFDPQEDL